MQGSPSSRHTSGMKCVRFGYCSFGRGSFLSNDNPFSQLRQRDHIRVGFFEFRFWIFQTGKPRLNAERFR